MRLFLSLKAGGFLSFPGIDGATLLSPAGTSAAGGAVLDPAGLASFTLSVPPTPTLVGALGVLQALELGGPQPAFSNPAIIPILQ